MVATGQVNVGTSATLIHTAQGKTLIRLLLYVAPTGNLFIGSASVTTANGWVLGGGVIHEFMLNDGDSLYGIVASISPQPVVGFIALT